MVSCLKVIEDQMDWYFDNDMEKFKSEFERYYNQKFESYNRMKPIRRPLLKYNYLLIKELMLIWIFINSDISRPTGPFNPEGLE